MLRHSLLAPDEDKARGAEVFGMPKTSAPDGGRYSMRTPGTGSANAADQTQYQE